MSAEPLRERTVPEREVLERMWWATAAALNTDIDVSYNGLGRYPDELYELYSELRSSLHRFELEESRAPAVAAHALRWRLRARDVHTSLRLADIDEATSEAFTGPSLQMPLTAYQSGPRNDLVRIGPQHQKLDELVKFARRRIRRVAKGWSVAQIAKTEGVSRQAIQSSLKNWAQLDREVP